MKISTLRSTGIVMIVAGLIFSILSFFEVILRLHLQLSLTHTTLDQFGPAGRDIVMAFGVHIGSLVIALGIVMVGLSEFYQPEMKNYLNLAVGSWYVLDCISSVLLGYQLNVIPNTVFLLSFLVVMRKVEKEVQQQMDGNEE